MHFVEDEHRLERVPPHVFTWPLWTPLAELIVRREFSVDVTLVSVRDCAPRWQPPMLPPRPDLFAFLNPVPPHGLQEPNRKAEVSQAALIFIRPSSGHAAPAMYRRRYIVAARSATRHSQCGKIAAAVI